MQRERARVEKSCLGPLTWTPGLQDNRVPGVLDVRELGLELVVSLGKAGARNRAEGGCQGSSGDRLGR